MKKSLLASNLEQERRHKAQEIRALRKELLTLRRAETFYRQAMENSPNAIFSITRDGNIQKWNKSCSTLFGYKRDIVGKPYTLLLTEDNNQQKIADIVQKVFHGQTFTNVTIIYKALNGEKKYMISRIYPMFDSDNSVIMCFFANTDNTQRRITDEKIRRLSSAIEQSIDGIVISDLDHNIEYANVRSAEMHGFSHSEMQSLALSNMIAQQSQNIYLKAQEEVQRLGSWTGEIEHNHKNGMTFPVFLSLTLLRDSTDTPSAILAIMRDISKRKQMEEQLTQDQKIKAIGTLAGGIAHNFNNLLMGIMGNTSLALKKLGPQDKNYNRFKAIELCVNQGASLAKQLLAYAREGNYEVSPSNINSIIESATTIFGGAKKEIKIDLQLEKKIWTVEVDQNQIEQSLLNLFVNSWQAMPDGGTITVKSYNSQDGSEMERSLQVPEGKYVGISITDTGFGISADIIDRIFDPFFTTKSPLGTGMGLASVYGTIKSHNGFITANSQLGKGTCFKILFPASSDSVDEPEDHISSGLFTGNNETILLIDDEKIIIEICSEMLQEMDYLVLTAMNADDGIDLFKKHKDVISCIILDLIMPGMGGIQAFHLLRNIDPEIKILLSSGYNLDERALALLKNKYCTFIKKPFSMKSLSEELNKILSH